MRASVTSNVVLVVVGAGLASIYGCSSEATPPVYGSAAGTTSTPGAAGTTTRTVLVGHFAVAGGAG